MSELVVFVLRIVFLALLWLFILFVANIIRTDMRGRAVPATGKSKKESAPLPAPPIAEAVPAPAPAPVASSRRSSRQRPKHVTVDNGPLAGRLFNATTDLSIGRGLENAIVLTDDFASGNHARIEPGSDGVYLVDLGSTNGTFVNDNKVTGRVLLRPGDQIRIGRTTMTLGR